MVCFRIVPLTLSHLLVLQTPAGCCQVSIKGEDSRENLGETEVSREESLIDLSKATELDHWVIS